MCTTTTSRRIFSNEECNIQGTKESRRGSGLFSDALDLYFIVQRIIVFSRQLVDTPWIMMYKVIRWGPSAETSTYSSALPSTVDLRYPEQTQRRRPGVRTHTCACPVVDRGGCTH